MRISLTQGLGAFAYAGPMRISYFSGLRAQSIHRVFYPPFLASTSTIIGFATGGGDPNGGGGGEPGHGWDVELIAGRIPEINPYKPQVPESLIKLDDGGREIFDWLEEQQKTIRLQHNITQAGDTTYPHELIIHTHTDKQFTLGSVGKFYHPQFGMILARYVRFEKMDPNIAGTAPVGLIKETTTLEWVVTNRYAISSPYLCVGLCASYVVPPDDSYGWVIIDGANLQALANESETAAQGEGFVWAGDGTISNQGEGVIIARRLDDTGLTRLIRGQAWIRLESWSGDSIVSILDPYIQRIIALEAAVEELEGITGATGSLAELASQIQVLSTRLDAEANARRAADTALNARIDGLNFVTIEQLNSAVTLINNQILNLQTSLESSIAATHAIALEALDKANQALAIDLAGINQAITEILALLAAETARAKGKFPVVDGSVPPNLMYLDDGSLVYTETY